VSQTDKLKITLTVAERQYPLNIARPDEEVFRKAASRIEEVLHSFRRDYQIEDKIDLLAMVCLRLATEAESAKQRHNSHAAKVEQEIGRLLEMIPQV
jgi:cell division protein ZapA